MTSTPFIVAVAALGVFALPAQAQTAAPVSTPTRAKAHKHKTPNLEMDVNGTGAPPQVTGPNTSTSDIGTGDRSGSDGASSTLAPVAPLLTPASPPPGADPRAPLQPGGLAPTPLPHG